MQTLSEVARIMWWSEQKRKETGSHKSESKESERTKMGKVIEMKKREECLAYLTGETLLIAAEMQGRMIYDLDGKPIREGELYKVTPNGAERVA